MASISPGPAEKHARIVQKATELTYRIQLIRYKFARAALEKIRDEFKSRPWIVEVNGYQTYIWTPFEQKELRMWPYSLTAKSESLLDKQAYAPRSPPINVNWNSVFDSLAAKFTLKTAVFESIKGLFDIITQAEIKKTEVYPEEWDGRVQFGEFSGYYKLSEVGIRIAYYEPATESVMELVVATSEVEKCEAKKKLYELLKEALSGVEVVCGGEQVTMSYSGPVCSDLDQLVTFLRQLYDKKAYCISYKAKRIVFLDGPLQNLEWTAATQFDYIFYDGQKAIVVDVDQLSEWLKKAKENCAKAMEKTACKK